METTTTATTTTTTTTTAVEYEKGVPPLPPPASETKLSATDAILRVLMLAASVVVVVVMVTSKENHDLILGPFLIPHPAKFTDSPAFIYFVAAFSVAALYSIITGLASLSIVWKPSIPPKWLFILITLDILMLGIAASATGAAGGVAYIGLKGNYHVRWDKICDIYGKFCRYVGSSIAVALFASLVLVLLIISNAHSLYRRVV